MNSLKERGHTKLKFTVASFILHTVLGLVWSITWIITSSTEPLVWASWFASLNTTLAVYCTAKTIKDRAIIADKEEEK